MSKDRALHEAPRKKRPSIFWWSLAHLLAIAFAAAAWTTCLYVFNYPEKPGNYDLLRQIGRLPPVTEFDPLKAPDGTATDPEALYKKFFPQKPEDLAGLNLQFRRGYIRNYRKADPRFTIYVDGNFVVESASLLGEADFFHPGLRIRARALVQPDELSDPAPYPVYLDLLLPTSAEPSTEYFGEGDLLVLEHIDHRAAVLHAARADLAGEAAVLITAAPLAYENFQSDDSAPLSLAAPPELNLAAVFKSEADD